MAVPPTSPGPSLQLSDFATSSSFPTFPSTRLIPVRYAYPTQTQNTEPVSDLLKSIRSALRGSDTSEDEVHSAYYDWPSPYGYPPILREISWNRDTVVLSAGGVVLRQWSFAHEQQPIQWVCVGALEQTGITISSRSSGHYTSEFHAGPSKTSSSSSKSSTTERPTFGPFARAEQERKRAIEPETRSRAVFVFLRSMGKIYLDNGLEYTFALPFIVRKAWPLYPHGVMIQRVLDRSEILEAEQTGEEPLPTLFSITSPLAEATVVGNATSIVGGFKGIPPILEEESEGSSVPPKEMIVDITGRTTGDDVDVLVSVDTETRKLSIWRYVYVRPKDLPTAKKTSSQSRKKRNSGVTGRRRASLGGNESFIFGAPQPLTAADPATSPTVLDDRLLEKSPTAPDVHLPPLSALPGMAPSLTTMAEMANLVAPPADPKPVSLPPSPAPKARRNSLGQKDANSTGEKVPVMTKAEDVEAALSATDHTRMRSTYWVTKLFSVDIASEE